MGGGTSKNTKTHPKSGPREASKLKQKTEEGDGDTEGPREASKLKQKTEEGPREASKLKQKTEEGDGDTEELREDNTKLLEERKELSNQIKAVEQVQHKHWEQVVELERQWISDNHELAIKKNEQTTLEKRMKAVEIHLQTDRNSTTQQQDADNVKVMAAVQAWAKESGFDFSTADGLKRLCAELKKMNTQICDQVNGIQDKVEANKKGFEGINNELKKCRDEICELQRKMNDISNKIANNNRKISKLDAPPRNAVQPGLKTTERLAEIISAYLDMDESSAMSDASLLEAIHPVDPIQKLEVISDKKHADGGTALHVAADRNHEIMLDGLLNNLNEEQTCQLLNAQDNLGQTVFHRLAKKGFHQTFDTLLQKVSIDKKLQTQTVRDKKGETAILTAALSAQTQTVSTVINCLSIDDLYKLLSSTADDWTRQTFMHQFISSVTNPDVKIVNRISVQLGFDGWCKLLALTDYCGRTPLHVATSTKHVEITKEMIAVTETKNLVHLWRIADHSRGTAMRNAANPAHVTVLEDLAERLNSEQLFELLRFPYKKQETLIHILVKKNDSALLELFVGKMEDEHKHGILTITDRSGFTPIHTAISCDHCEILKNLLKYLPPESAKTYNLLSKTDNKFHDTNIHLAAEKGNIEGLELMFEKLTKEQKMELLNQQNDYKWTPHVAAKMHAKDKAAEWLEKTMESLERVVNNPLEILRWCDSYFVLGDIQETDQICDLTSCSSATGAL